MTAWMARPAITVTMYRPNWLRVFEMLAMDMSRPAIKHVMPKGEYLEGKDLLKE